MSVNFSIRATIVAFLIGNAAVAQINESDTLSFQLKTSFTGNYQTGNLTVLTVRSRLDAAVKFSENVVFKTQNSSLYQEFFNNKADNDIFSRNYLYYKPQNKIYPYAIAYVSSNYRRKVDLRYFAGLGLTYQPIKSKNNVLKISANALYEQSDFSVRIFNDAFYNGTPQIKVWRATAFVSGFSWLFERRLRLYYDAFWQPALDKISNYRAQVDIGIDFPIWKGLAFNALYTYSHENVVPINTKTTDNILTFGLSYSQQFK